MTDALLILVGAVLVNNFIDNAQQQGLLKTQNFVDVLKMIVTLRVRHVLAPCACLRLYCM
jgi:hypothetical protein